MRSKFMIQTVVLVALVVVGVWYARSGDEKSEPGGPDKARSAAGKGRAHSSGTEERPAEASRSGSGGAKRHTALDGIKSPIARRYLGFMVAEDGRLARESHAPSIVNNAFAQAWILTSRMDLSDEQQDRLAEFLLSEDWLRWASMDGDRIRTWASANLSAEQQSILKEFLDEQKEGAATMAELKRTLRKVEHGDRSEAEVLAAEMSAIKALLAAKPSGGSPTTPPVVEMDAEAQKKHAEYVQTEQAFRFYNLMADRIPFTNEQHQAVYAAIRSGEEPPINPYDYQSFGQKRAEAAVRANTRWLGKLLTEAQYETYIWHFLAEIEMIRFQNQPR